MKFMMRALALAGLASGLGTLVQAQDSTAELRDIYPSLGYVSAYRAAYPADVTGSDDFWTGTPDASLHGATASEVTRLLVGLADQHTALAGPKAGASETLGVLFRTSADGRMIVWRVIDPSITQVSERDEIIAIDGMGTADWLNRAATVSFGGNARSRQAEAAVHLALGTAADHEVAGLAQEVGLTVRTGDNAEKVVRLPYKSMDQGLATALAAAVNAPDLPEVLSVGNLRIGTYRIGAFAPQYDPVFVAAAETAEAVEAAAGSPELAAGSDGPMLAGFCAVTRTLIEKYDGIADRSDVMALDLRGNMGGFAREVRLFAWALLGHAPLSAYDVMASDIDGQVRLKALDDDPGCGSVKSTKPLLVLVDAGTRSGGELLATYLWAGGATVLGERTIGAGGGRDSASRGIPMGASGYRALVSESFYVFDPTGELQEGTMDESILVERVSAEAFAPSRRRPYMTQAIGVLPDVPLATRGRDLLDGGRGLLERGVPAAVALSQ